MIPHTSLSLGAAGTDTAAVADRITAIVDPPAYCPGCFADAGQTWPSGATSQHCRRCLDRIRRVYQVQRWNHNHTHQVEAGHASCEAFPAFLPAGE